MNSKEICIEAIKKESTLLSDIDDYIGEVTSIEWRKFDQSYLDFLDKQIELGGRGLEWTERLNRRRANYSTFINRDLLSCQIVANGLVYNFRISPDSCEVIHYEFYSYGPC